ncbi:origin recognition complex, subunit 6 [Lasiosphaeris hirsuta]|uniref:Origin recognition complex, subunit 6 n=1 Tax=Lasiosphaeris hirsuta TaxID=260670 RepID=A0AA39ZWE2_9PEZI|nr:origin recognition complex, subunit 6 [Lasiosphaeris hirsuta]
MNRSIEQALLSLLPTHNSTLPQPLTELASSLLAQSRHRASTLKAEEEISRPYACAHIACDRLKITLNLPPIEPRPPIPPRIYKRLYNHLDNILPASSSTPGRGTPSGNDAVQRLRTPRGKLRAPAASGANTPLGTSPLANKTRPTPSKATTLAQFRATPLGQTPNKAPRAARGKLSSSAAADALPPWIRPVLRFLCVALGPARSGPVVMSGVESIAAPRGVRSADEWVASNLSALLAALYLYVWRGLTAHGEDIDAAEYVRFRKRLIGALKKARAEVVVTPKVDEEGEEGDPWEGWCDVKLKDLDTAALRINRHGWLELDWAAGIEDMVRAGEDADDREDQDEADEETPEPVQIRRADTMFQERYDYLSERRRKEYVVWKEGILRKIEELEGPTRRRVRDEDAMDIDEEL